METILVGCSVERGPRRTSSRSTTIYSVQATVSLGQRRCDLDLYRFAPVLLCVQFDRCEFDLDDENDDGVCARCPKMSGHDVDDYHGYSNIELSRDPSCPDDARDLIVEAFKRALGRTPPYSFLFNAPWGHLPDGGMEPRGDGPESWLVGCSTKCPKGKPEYYELKATGSPGSTRFRLEIASYRDAPACRVHRTCKLNDSRGEDGFCAECPKRLTKEFLGYDSLWEGDLLRPPTSPHEARELIYEAYFRQVGKSPPCAFLFDQHWRMVGSDQGQADQPTHHNDGSDETRNIW